MSTVAVSWTEVLVEMDVSEEDAVDGAALASSTGFVLVFRVSFVFFTVTGAVLVAAAEDGITLVIESVRLCR